MAAPEQTQSEKEKESRLIELNEGDCRKVYDYKELALKLLNLSGELKAKVKSAEDHLTKLKTIRIAERKAARAAASSSEGLGSALDSEPTTTADGDSAEDKSASPPDDSNLPFVFDDNYRVVNMAPEFHEFLNTIFTTTKDIELAHIMISSTIKGVDEKLEELDSKTKKVAKQSNSMFT